MRILGSLALLGASLVLGHGAAGAVPAAAEASCGSSNWNGVVVVAQSPPDTYFCNPGFIYPPGTVIQLATKVTNRYWFHVFLSNGDVAADCYESSTGNHTWAISGRDGSANVENVQMSATTTPC
jgi:hypothetical protein